LPHQTRQCLIDGRACAEIQEIPGRDCYTLLRTQSRKYFFGNRMGNVPWREEWFIVSKMDLVSDIMAYVRGWSTPVPHVTATLEYTYQGGLLRSVPARESPRLREADQLRLHCQARQLGQRGGMRTELPDQPTLRPAVSLAVDL
jgi:hypothetical protein